MASRCNGKFFEILISANFRNRLQIFIGFFNLFEFLLFSGTRVLGIFSKA